MNVSALRIISVIHGQVNQEGESKQYRDRLREAGKIQKVTSDDVISQCLEARQVMTLGRAGLMINFGVVDLEHNQTPSDDPLIISLNIANCLVTRILVDNESSVEILFLNTFLEIGLSKKDVKPMKTPLVGSDGTSMIPMGTIKADVTAVGKLLSVDFVMLEANSPYNVIMGKSWIHQMRAVPLTLYQVISCVADDGSIRDIKGD